MKTGLRTEIVTSICLLLGAALLFAGFLLVKLTERELLEQQRAHSRATVVMVLTMLGGVGQDLLGASGENLAHRALGALDNQPDVIGWRLLDDNMQVMASLVTGTMHAFPDLSAAAMGPRDIHETLVYSSQWLPWQEPSASYLDLAASVAFANGTSGLLQVRYSLEGLIARVHRAQRLILVYVIGYGLILAMFGVYLLNRNVVQPVRRLQQASAEVASGSLQEVDIGSGPGEITGLAESFNHMVAALKLSRKETDAHILSLEEANQALKQAHDELVRSEKMASVGHLAAGMAHEIGNPLGALVGYLGVLQTDLQQEDEQDLVKRALAETRRIDTLVRELLDYAAPGRCQSESFSPVATLRETVTMLKHQGAFDHVVIADDCGEDADQVCMDPQRLQQVWVNLLLNARDAMDGQGTIRLAAGRNGGWLKISITDDGSGMSEAHVGQVFEPFYTTKDPGKGRGLGLAVCQRIINEAGGRIDVASQVGQGSTFSICLPRVEENT